ncbi:MAG: aldolase/citrate lyase family protein [Clostridiaceae bacterium]
MTLKLMYITNNAEIAKIAEKSDVDWIFIDLEINGKEERQGHLDTVISHHNINDVKRIKNVLNRSVLLVRVNPIFDGSKAEIDKVIDDGADIVMLPFFKTKEEVATFVDIVGGRAKTCLLLETPEAVNNIDNILGLSGIDYIHIGLNDLHLGYGMKFMFELLADGTVEKICSKIKDKGIPYGFGGIAQLGQGDLPTEHVIAEHHRIGSSMAILSRSFCNVNKVESINEAEKVFDRGVSEIREFEEQLQVKEEDFFEENRLIARDKINAIRDRK